MKLYKPVCAKSHELIYLTNLSISRTYLLVSHAVMRGLRRALDNAVKVTEGRTCRREVSEVLDGDTQRERTESCRGDMGWKGTFKVPVELGRVCRSSAQLS